MTLLNVTLPVGNVSLFLSHLRRSSLYWDTYTQTGTGDGSNNCRIIVRISGFKASYMPRLMKLSCASRMLVLQDDASRWELHGDGQWNLTEATMIDNYAQAL